MGVGVPLDPSPGSVVPGELVPGVVPPGLPSKDPEVTGGLPPDELPGPFVDSPFDDVAPPLVEPSDVPELDELPELVGPREPLDELDPLDTPLATTCPRLSA